MNIPAHITIHQGGPDRYDLECSVCRTGWSGGATFGPIRGADLAATFIVQHAIHAKNGSPHGLTPSGRKRGAAIEALR